MKRKMTPTIGTTARMMMVLVSVGYEVDEGMLLVEAELESVRQKPLILQETGLAHCEQGRHIVPVSETK